MTQLALDIQCQFSFIAMREIVSEEWKSQRRGVGYERVVSEIHALKERVGYEGVRLDTCQTDVLEKCQTGLLSARFTMSLNLKADQQILCHFEAHLSYLSHRQSSRVSDGVGVSCTQSLTAYTPLMTQEQASSLKSCHARLMTLGSRRQSTME